MIFKKNLGDNEILQAAEKAKNVLEAMYGLLDAMDRKTGFDTATAEAESRYKAANEAELAKVAELDKLDEQLKKAKQSVADAKDKSADVIENANKQAETTRAFAAMESAKIIKEADEYASNTLQSLRTVESELIAANKMKRAESESLDIGIAEKQKEYDGLQAKIDAAINSAKESISKIVQ